MVDGQLYKRLAGNRTDLEPWLKANAIFGAILAVGLIAMALTGSADSGVVQGAVTTSQTAKIGSVVKPIQSRTASVLSTWD